MSMQIVSGSMNQKYQIQLSSGELIHRNVRFKGELRKGMLGYARHSNERIALVLVRYRPVGPSSQQMLISWAQVDEWNRHLISL